MSPKTALGVVQSLTGPRKRMHVTAGHAAWIPTKDELNDLAELFVKANSDPRGAVVVTRDHVKVDFVEDIGAPPPLQDCLNAMLLLYGKQMFPLLRHDDNTRESLVQLFARWSHMTENDLKRSISRN